MDDLGLARAGHDPRIDTPPFDLAPRPPARTRRPDREPAPATMRDVFELLARLDPNETLDELLARVDFGGTDAAGVRALLLDKPREPPLDRPREPPLDRPREPPLDRPCGPAGGDPAETFRETLLSREFRAAAPVSFPRAFPELAREIFVHVPKCAGTDLTLNLRDRMLTLAVDTIAPAWIADDDFVARLAALARAAPEHDRLFVHGHFDLGPYLAGNGRRAGDRVFSIVREPVALMVSQANYKIGRLLQDPAGRDLDTAETLARLGMDRLPEPVIHTDLKDLAVRALLDPGIAQPNLACRHLGRGPESRFEDAILQIVANDVELTTTTHYDAWLHRRWAVPRSERHNRSVPWLTEYEAARLHGAHLDRATAEDRVLHDLVAWAIETTGGDCVTGRQLARLAAPRPLAGFARELSTARHEARRQLPRRPIVIEEPTFVALFLHRPSVPGAATVRTVLSAGFGTGGDGNAYLGCGWSAPEDGFVWSDGFAAELYLPACPGEGRLALRLVGSPFVADGAASRELVLSVNGWPVGESMLRDLSVVEFDVADDLAEGPLMLTIGVPGARMACETDGSDDKRRLGFCLRRVEAVRYAA